MNYREITFYVSGTHCPSCKIFIEDILNEQVGIRNATVDLKKEVVIVETILDLDPKKLAEELTGKIMKNGYSLSVSKQEKEKRNYEDIWLALSIGLTLLILFFLVQKSGLINFGIGETVTPLTSLIIGLVASVSSCLAVVGGLVLSLSATVSRDSIPDTKPMFLFHSGRLIGFMLLGGVLGGVGGFIGIGFTATAVLGLIASAVMIVLGLNLVGILEKSSITLPISLFKFFRNLEQKTGAPFLLGLGTFFLPCGFTQAMQVVALSSGSFISGSLIMGAFALGTLPMLSFLSFGSASFAKSKYSPLFFKTAGVVVIGLGLFAFLGGLIGLGIISPLFNI